MEPRTTSALLWGAVGFVGFLAVVQAYQLLVRPLPVGLLALFGLGLVVGGLAAGVSYVSEARLTAKGRT